MGEWLKSEMLYIPLQSFLGLYSYPLGNKLAVNEEVLNTQLYVKRGNHSSAMVFDDVEETSH